MNGRNIVIILAVLSITAAVFTAVGVKSRDTKPPKITFEESEIHLSGADTESLLAGVYAADERDGDVSDTLIISKVFEDSQNSGTVVYAARDKANNIAVSSRKFTFDPVNREAIFGGTAAVDSETEDMPDDGNPDEGTPDDADPDVDNEPDDDPDGTISDVEDDRNGNLSDEEYAALREENLANGVPVIRLNTYVVNLERGKRFNFYSYIKEVEDDIDTINTMLRLDSNVDTSAPGEYEAVFYAVDSDGNVSNKEKMKVIVE